MDNCSTMSNSCPQLFMELAKASHPNSRPRALHAPDKFSNNLVRFIAFERFLAKPKVVWRFLSSWGQLLDNVASRRAKLGRKPNDRTRLGALTRLQTLESQYLEPGDSAKILDMLGG